MGSFGGIEWLVIVLVVLLLFGAKKIPELARGLGQGLTEFRKASTDIRKEIEKGSEEPSMSERDLDRRRSEDKKKTEKPKEESAETEKPKEETAKADDTKKETAKSEKQAEN